MYWKEQLYHMSCGICRNTSLLATFHSSFLGMGAKISHLSYLTVRPGSREKYHGILHAYSRHKSLGKRSPVLLFFTVLIPILVPKRRIVLADGRSSHLQSFAPTEFGNFPNSIGSKSLLQALLQNTRRNRTSSREISLRSFLDCEFASLFKNTTRSHLPPPRKAKFASQIE